MQKIIEYAVSTLAFRETQLSPYPELVFGAAPGMPQSVGWVFRAHVYFTLYSGSVDEVSQSFMRTPLRAFEVDVLHRLPISTNWRIKRFVVRQDSGFALKRLIAEGPHGEAAILFEADSFDPAQLERFSALSIGRTYGAVVSEIPTVDRTITG
jgi:hypothetical protein